MADEWSVELPASRQAIVFADLVESVRLYERYESRTIEGWRRFAALASQNPINQSSLFETESVSPSQALARALEAK